MRQIRARIQEKRGVDYTEQQIQELANVKLERFLDPKGVRSDLVEQFKQTRSQAGAIPSSPGAVTWFRRGDVVRNASRHPSSDTPAAQSDPEAVLQSRARSFTRFTSRPKSTRLYEGQFYFLREKIQQRDEIDVLYYELVHNLVLELTRVGIENRNLKMRLESLSSRMDFDERRARALEGRGSVSRGDGPRARSPRQPQARSFNQSPPPQQPLEQRTQAQPGSGSRRTGSRVEHSTPAAPAAARPPRRAWPCARRDRRARNRRSKRGRPRIPPRRHMEIRLRDAALESDHSESDFEPGFRFRRRRRAGPLRAVKLAIVVQRYGADINGGAELHARYIAEHLSRHADVEVLTTCARDYVTWRDEYPAGVEPNQRRRRCAAFVSITSATFTSLLDCRTMSSVTSTHISTSSSGWTLKGRRARRCCRMFARPKRHMTTFFFSATGISTRTTACARRRRGQYWSQRQSATKRSGLAISPRIFRGVRALDVQQPRRKTNDSGRLRQPRRAWRGRRDRLRDRQTAAGGPVQAEVRDRGPFRLICGPHRSEQGLPRAVFVLSERTSSAAERSPPRA